MPNPSVFISHFSSLPNPVFQQEFDFTLSFIFPPPSHPLFLKRGGVFLGGGSAHQRQVFEP